jgi:hypothetical protein
MAKRNKGRRKPKPSQTAAADEGQASVENRLARPTISALPLLRHDILLRVLSYCVYSISPKFSTEPEKLYTHVALRVPREASWFATVARTCKAWVEPALQHLYHTLHVHQLRIPSFVLVRMGHRVRTLVIELGPSKTQLKPNIPFDLFTGLSNLIVFGPSHPLMVQYFAALIRHIRPSPVLQNLARLDLLLPMPLEGWMPLVALLKACTDLRRFYCIIDDQHGGPTQAEAFGLVRPERLEEFRLSGETSMDSVLASFYSSTQLVTLDVWALIRSMDYRPFCRAIEASSHSLRAICLYVPSILMNVDQRLAGQTLANALASCTSLRFLRLGELFLMFGSMTLHDLFERLAPLPIEMLSFNDNSHESTVVIELYDSLHLLPNLSVVLFRRNIDQDSPRHALAIRRLQSRFPNLVIENLEDVMVWPPPYHTLSPEARAIFEFRPYRATSPPSIPSASS